MGFKLSNEGEEISSTKKSATDNPISKQTNLNTSSVDSDFSDDTFDPAAENTVFIANQYQRTAPVEDTVSTSYITHKTTLAPILMYISMAIDLLIIVLMITTLNNATDLNDLYTASSSYTLLQLLSKGLLIADAVWMCKRGNKFSLILWAIFFPLVYYFKRCSANGDSSIFAVVYLVILLALTGFYFMSARNYLNNSRGVTTTYNTETTEAPMPLEEQIEYLSRKYYDIDGNKYYFDKIIEGNIENPTYEYVPQSNMAPAHLSVSGTTTLNGKNQKIEMRFNSKTFKIQGITIGLKSYTNDTAIYEVLEKMFENTTPQ